MDPEQPVLTVVLVSPDSSIRSSQHTRLELDGYRVRDVVEPVLARRAVQEAEADLVVVDCVSDPVAGDLLVSVLRSDRRCSGAALLRLSLEADGIDGEAAGRHLAYRVVERPLRAAAPLLHIAKAG